MKAIIQRVQRASVAVDGNVIGKIDAGFMILLGVEKEDTEIEAEVLASKISVLRVLCDENDKMNLSLSDIKGSVLVISNFTLCGDCRKGRRPSFDNAARPETALPLYDYFCECMRKADIPVEKGEFGADMKVDLLNDGPVTFIIDSKELAR